MKTTADILRALRAETPLSAVMEASDRLEARRRLTLRALRGAIRRQVFAALDAAGIDPEAPEAKAAASARIVELLDANLGGYERAHGQLGSIAAEWHSQRAQERAEQAAPAGWQTVEGGPASPSVRLPEPSRVPACDAEDMAAEADAGVWDALTAALDEAADAAYLDPHEAVEDVVEAARYTFFPPEGMGVTVRVRWAPTLEDGRENVATLPSIMQAREWLCRQLVGFARVLAEVGVDPATADPRDLLYCARRVEIGLMPGDGGSLEHVCEWHMDEL